MLRIRVLAALLLLAGCGVRRDLPTLVGAARDGRVDLIPVLVRQGADPNQRSGVNGWTPLMMAAGYGYTDLVNVLLDRGADARLQTSDGMNALTLAVLGTPDIDRFTVGDCQASTVRALLEKAPDLHVQGSERVMRAIASAKIKGCAGVAKLLGNRYP